MRWLVLGIALTYLSEGLSWAGDLPVELLPPRSVIVERGKSYVIFEKPIGSAGFLHILFDAREAMTDNVIDLPFLDGSDETLAVLDPTHKSAVVIEGRHRAVAASNGVEIPASLGGTGVPYWLIYKYSSVPGGLDDSETFENLRPLRSFQLTHSHACRAVLEEHGGLKP